MSTRILSTPLFRQTFVTIGPTLATSQFGLVMAFTSSFLPELRAPDSIIRVDDVTASWIASVPYLSSLAGCVITPALMGKCGRKPSSIISALFFTISWILITGASSLLIVIFARLLQGLALGLTWCLSPICVGEYTSPKYRGPFLTFLSLAMASGTFIAHALGGYVAWQKRALICAVISFVNLIIFLYSPESPSWLIDKGRHDDGIEAFHWLRGFDEEDELKCMIENDILMKEQIIIKDRKLNLKHYWTIVKDTIRKPEFYKPIFIMMNLNAILQFSGVNVLATYAEDIYREIIGQDLDIHLIIISCDIQRLITNLIFIFLMSKLKRKTILISSVFLNSFAYLAIAAYVYAKSVGLVYERAYLGIILVHLLLFSIAAGTVTLPLTISGEIFPFKYRSLSSVLSVVTTSPIAGIVLKTYLLCTNSIGLYGTFIVYSLILIISLALSLIYLPETKDKTLHQIEEAFTGKTNIDTDITLSLTKIT